MDEVDFNDAEIAVDPILRFFTQAHNYDMRAVKLPFVVTARFIVDNVPRSAERTVALRHLLDAKEAAIRACL